MGSEFFGNVLYGLTFGTVDVNKQTRNAKAAAQRDASNQDLGNVTGEEAQASASKKAFRKGLIFTSPTGTLGSGSRGRSRLTGK